MERVLNVATIYHKLKFIGYRNAYEIPSMLHLIPKHIRIDKSLERTLAKKFQDDGALKCSNQSEVREIAIKRMMAEGLILEFGVLKGSSINFFARNMRDRTIHGFDSFEGFGEVPTGVWKKYSTRNKSYFKNELPEVEKNVILHKGYFHYTLPEFIKNHTEDISLLHIDCDIYSSTREIFQNLGAQIVPGTIIIFDEYFNYPGWQFHEYLAFQEFVKKYDIKYTVLAYGANAEGFGFYGKMALRIDEITKF